MPGKRKNESRKATEEGKIMLEQKSVGVITNRQLSVKV